MVDELDPAGRRERGEMISVRCRTGYEPRARRELLALFPLRNGPDVLRMSGRTPRQALEHRGVARHRGRGMQEVRVQPVNVVTQLRREDQRLTEPPDAVRRGIASQVAQPLLPRRSIRRPASHLPPCLQDPKRRPIQVLRKVEHASTDLAMHGVSLAVGRAAQRYDQDVEAAALQGRDFLRDEGLGEPRVALEYERAASFTFSTHGAISRATFGRPSSRPGTTTSDGLF